MEPTITYILYQKGREHMPLPKSNNHTSEDYWNLPEGERAELIDGHLYSMAPPSSTHQELIFQLSHLLWDYIRTHDGKCKVFLAPFAVNLDAEDKNYVEPDISIICDPSKVDLRGCKGAPDFIAEVVSPSSRKLDYVTKTNLYLNAGVREYWIIDPFKKCTTVYNFEEDAAPKIISFSMPLTIEIYGDFNVTINDLFQ